MLLGRNVVKVMGSSPARVMLIEVDVMTSRKKLVQLCSAILADVVGSQCGGSESHGFKPLTLQRP
jgi:hypothetical protein